MAKYFIEDTTLKNMADTIRSLTGNTASMTPSEMTAEVQVAEENVESAMTALETLGVVIPEGSDIGDLADLVGDVESGVDTSDATATASDILSGETAYVNGEKITGSIPTISARTITPTTSNQTAVSAGNYVSGDIVVSGDSNLAAENIAEGISIFGVVGTHSGSEEGSSQINLETINIYENGTYYPSEGYEGIGEVYVEVHSSDVVEVFFDIDISSTDSSSFWIAYTRLDTDSLRPIFRECPSGTIHAIDSVLGAPITIWNYDQPFTITGDEDGNIDIINNESSVVNSIIPLQSGYCGTLTVTTP